MKQSSFLLNKKIGEENHTEVGIVAYYKLDTPQKLAEICLDVDECTSFFRWRRYRKSILIYMNRYKADKKVVKEHKKMKKQAAHSSLHEQFHNVKFIFSLPSYSRSSLNQPLFSLEYKIPSDPTKSIIRS